MTHSRFQLISAKLIPAAAALAALLAAGHAAHAQAPTVLSLVPAVPVAAVGSTVTFTVDLTGGANVGLYDFNIFLDPSQLQFVGTSPFTSVDPDFPTGLTDQLVTPGDLRAAFGQSFTATGGVNNIGPTALGTFQVKVLSVPLTGSMVTFGSPGLGSNQGGSEVLDSTTASNELTAATGATLLAPVPEVSTAASFGLLLAFCFGGLLVTARKKSAA